MRYSVTLTKANIREVARRLQEFLKGKQITSVRTNEHFKGKIEIHTKDPLGGIRGLNYGDPGNVHVNETDDYLSIHLRRSGLLTFATRIENEETAPRAELDLHADFEFLPEDFDGPERVQISYLNNASDRNLIVHVMYPTGDLKKGS